MSDVNLRTYEEIIGKIRQFVKVSNNKYRIFNIDRSKNTDDKLYLCRHPFEIDKLKLYKGSETRDSPDDDDFSNVEDASLWELERDGRNYRIFNEKKGVPKLYLTNLGKDDTGDVTNKVFINEWE